MSSNYPPNPYFNNINFNNAFFSAGVGNYITLSYANSHYLFSTGTAISNATTTFFSGNIGIGTSASSYQLDVYGTSTNMIRLQSGGTNGQLILSPGVSGSLGYVQFMNNGGVQVGYVGYGQALSNYIDLSAQNGYLGYRANGNLIVASQLAVGGNTINSGTALTVTGHTTTSGNLGIGTTYSSTYNLDVYGVSIFTAKQGGYPSGGAIGSDGMAIVIYGGTSSSQCMALGFGAYQLWYNVPSGNYHDFYVGGTSILTISSAGLSTTGVSTSGASYISASSPYSGNNYLDVGGTSTSTFYSYLNGLRIAGTDANTLYLPPGVGSGNLTLTAGDTTKNLKLSVGNGNILVSVSNTGTTMYGSTSINSLGIGTAADGTAGDLTVNNNCTVNNNLTVSNGLYVTYNAIINNPLITGTMSIGGGAPAVSTSYTTAAGAQSGNNITTWPVGGLLWGGGAGSTVTAYNLSSGVSMSLKATNIILAQGFVSTSDRRIKRDFKPINEALDIIEKLEPTNYNVIETAQNCYGFIAQEVEEIIPNIVIPSFKYIPNIFEKAIHISNGLIKYKSTKNITS